MLNINVSISSSLPQQHCYSVVRNEHYRVQNANHNNDYLPIPEKVKSSFQHQFEQVGSKDKQQKRKRALKQIVGEVYACACGVINVEATEELYLSFSNVTMNFYVTPKTKALFFNWFQDVRRDKYAKSRWYVLGALVYYAWLAAKQP
jgi:hypothetical protein